MTTNRKEKKEIVLEIRRFFRQWKAVCCPELDERMACFYWSVVAHTKLKERGYKSLITAGSLSWPRIDLDRDDGKVMTHYSYQWEPDSPATAARLIEGVMPEMHVWVQLPDERSIVDLTTRYLPDQCRRAAKMEWLAPKPPDFLWCQPEQLPRGVHYTPSESATALIPLFVQRQWNIKEETNEAV